MHDVTKVERCGYQARLGLAGPPQTQDNKIGQPNYNPTIKSTHWKNLYKTDDEKSDQQALENRRYSEKIENKISPIWCSSSSSGKLAERSLELSRTPSLSLSLSASEFMDIADRVLCLERISLLYQNQNSEFQNASDRRLGLSVSSSIRIWAFL